MFTTHDVSLLEPTSPGGGAIEREHMWVTDKGADGAATLTAVADFKPRKDENLRRRYLVGRFGGVPDNSEYRPEGVERPYDDAMGVDGFVRYKWRGDDPNHAENRALRQAMIDGVPLVWFWGVGTALYKPVFPIYLINEEPALQQFVVATDGLQHLPAGSTLAEEVLRSYVIRETRQRLHQPVFRSLVMRAYNTRCAVCELGHSVLLDAAHIVEDGHDKGIASVRNGLALCKIHHAAYDAGILGVRPDLQVQIRADILEEIDGPLLEHGLKGLHGQRLRVVPQSKNERPDPDLLTIHYERFLAS